MKDEATSLRKRLSLKLFQASPGITDPSERRRAALLAALVLAHLVQVAGSMLAMSIVEPGSIGPLAWVLMGLVTAVEVGAYTMARTTRYKIGIWMLLAIGLATPLCFLALQLGKTDTYEMATYLVPAVLVASVLLSRRETFLVAASTVVLVVLVGAIWVRSDPAGIVHGVQFLLLQGVLICVFRRHRDSIEAERASELRGRNEELETLKDSLEVRIAARTQELSMRNEAMRLVLDNVGQGLFMIDALGRIQPEHSQVLSRWFGEPTPNQLFFRYLGRHSASFGSEAELAFEQVMEGWLPREVALAQMPSRLESYGRHYRLTYQALAVEPIAFLVVVTDATDEVERETATREKSEVAKIAEHLVADRRAFLAFLDEGNELLERVVSPRPGLLRGDDQERRRAIHTLKGNASLFGLDNMSAACHALENRLAEGFVPSARDLAPLVLRWENVIMFAHMLVGEHRDMFEVSSSELERILVDLVATNAHPAVIASVDALRLEPAERRLHSLGVHVSRLGARFGKEIEVLVESDGSRLEARRYEPIWSALAHTLRNAVDHGIESPDERALAGKPACGTVSLRANREGADLVIEIQDDGRGMDWAALQQRFAARGIHVSTVDEITQALLRHGASTAQEVTDISGRGVGMSALHEAVEAMGGSVRIMSTLGMGTKIIVSIPMPTTKGAYGSLSYHPIPPSARRPSLLPVGQVPGGAVSSGVPSSLM